MSEDYTQWIPSSIVKTDRSNVGMAQSILLMLMLTTIAGCPQEDEGMPAGWYAAHLLICSLDGANPRITTL